MAWISFEFYFARFEGFMYQDNETSIHKTPNPYHLGARIQKFYDRMQAIHDEHEQELARTGEDEPETQVLRGHRDLVSDLMDYYSDAFDDIKANK